MCETESDRETKRETERDRETKRERYIEMDREKKEIENTEKK